MEASVFLHFPLYFMGKSPPECWISFCRISPSKITLFLPDIGTHDPHVFWILQLFMAIGPKAFLQHLTNTSYMHSFEKNTHNSKTKRDLMAIEGGGTLFHQYSKFKSEKYPCLRTLQKPCGRHPRIFSHWNAKPGRMLWFSFLIGRRCYWGPEVSLCWREAIKVKMSHVYQTF